MEIDVRMFESHQLKALRLGPVARAARVKEPTAHAWRTRNNLTIGSEKPGSQQRHYDLRDAASLLLMRLLTERLQMSAQAAALATNFARDKFTLLAAYEYTRIDHP